MQYSEYMAKYEAQKQREAQLIEKYSQKPVIPANTGLWETSAVEHHEYNDKQLWLRIAACSVIFGGIILLYCVFG